MVSEFALGFESLTTETHERLSVDGEVPSWLSGALFRNGPALFEAGGTSVRHWFDGLGMVRKFAISEGEVTYRNRFLRTDAYRDAERGELGAGFGTSVENALKRLRERVVPEATDNANVNVARFDERFVALTETPHVTEFDPETLETGGKIAFDDDLNGHLTTAHPHRDVRRGETVNLLTEFSLPSVYQVYRLPDGSLTRELLGEIEVREPAYIHSFGLTEEYVVLVEFPLVTHLLKLLWPTNVPFIERYDWKPERGTRFLVMDRETGGVVAEPRTEAFFAFHHVNAYQSGSELVCDLVTFPGPEAIKSLYLDELRSSEFSFPSGELTRFRLDLGNVRPDIERETLHAEGIQLPRVSPAVHRRKHRYVYGQGNRERPAEEFANRLIKVDVETSESRYYEREDCYFSEPVFVPRPGGDREDDGVVLAVVLDTEAERSSLLMLNGEAFEELARAEAPHAIPFDFHGQFFSDVS